MADDGSRIIVRKAVKEDMAEVIQMIQELADFEEMPDGPQLTAEDLIRDGGFDSNDTADNIHPLFYCFIAEEEMCTATNRSDDYDDDGNVDLKLNRHPMTRKSIGYSICFFSSYSTWGQRTFYMEDLYVKPSYRKLGIGKMLLQEVASYALETGCIRIDFQALKWNPAIKFYEKLGAELATFEKMFNEPSVSIEDLHRDGGFISSSDPVVFVCFIAEIVDDNKRRTIGYAIVFNCYSTWQGRILKLKDLYVRDDYKKLGAGRKLIKAIAEHATEVNAARLYFHVKEWNTLARQFYESLGATNGTEMDEWALLRLDKNAMDSLVKKKIVE